MTRLRLPLVGQRIRLVRMGEDPDPIPAGAEGTVVAVSDLGESAQVAVAWDDGRRLALALPEDLWEPA